MSIRRRSCSTLLTLLEEAVSVLFPKATVGTRSSSALMAVVLQERFREHVAVAEALKASYSSRDDIDRVQSIQQLEDELTQLCTSREADVLAIVKGKTPGHLAI